MTCSVCPEHTSFSGTKTHCPSGRHIREPVSALPKAGGDQVGSGLGGTTPPPEVLLGRWRAPVKLTNLQAQSPGMEPLTCARNIQTQDCLDGNMGQCTMIRIQGKICCSIQPDTPRRVGGFGISS